MLYSLKDELLNSTNKIVDIMGHEYIDGCVIVVCMNDGA